MSGVFPCGRITPATWRAQETAPFAVVRDTRILLPFATATEKIAPSGALAINCCDSATGSGGGLSEVFHCTCECAKLESNNEPKHAASSASPRFHNIMIFRFGYTRCPRCISPKTMQVDNLILRRAPLGTCVSQRPQHTNAQKQKRLPREPFSHVLKVHYNFGGF
jgi:hypothetical protein